jgi:hypothetical protein
MLTYEKPRYFVIPVEFGFGPELSDLNPYATVDEAIAEANAVSQCRPGVEFTIIETIGTVKAAEPVMPVADEGIKVGDIVKAVKDHSWGSRLVGSSVGIVVAIGLKDSVLVKFEGRTDLHNGNFEGFKSKNNDCWWFKVENLEVVEEECDDCDACLDGECTGECEDSVDDTVLDEKVDEIDDVVSDLVFDVDELKRRVAEHSKIILTLCESAIELRLKDAARA